jgi:hypothetical protein
MLETFDPEVMALTPHLQAVLDPLVQQAGREWTPATRIAP